MVASATVPEWDRWFVASMPTAGLPLPLSGRTDGASPLLECVFSDILFALALSLASRDSLCTVAIPEPSVQPSPRTVGKRRYRSLLCATRCRPLEGRRSSKDVNIVHELQSSECPERLSNDEDIVAREETRRNEEFQDQKREERPSR